MKKLILIAAALISVSAAAEPLRLHHLFTDGMVMQRETDAPVWGWGEPGAAVTVTASWDGQTAKAKVASDGTWLVVLKTGEAGGPYTMTVKSGGKTLTVSDILLGEVWVCSGQSNMEMPIGGFGFQGIEGADKAILESPRFAERLRVFDVKADTTHVLQTDVDAVWRKTSGAVTERTSAVAYFFGKRLTEALGVPVGLIVNAWGGSRIEPWMSWDAVRSAGVSPEEMTQIEALREKAGEWPHSTATCWNGRMAPIAGFAARGFLWYQGCSNIGQNCYDLLQAAMVRSWRTAWGRGDMPFLYVLLAPYEHGDKDGRWRPTFVEVQLRAESLVPACWAVSAETYGDPVTVHPAQKQEIADMLYMRAMQSVYGIEMGGSIELPKPDTVEYAADGTVHLRLTNVWGNLQSIQDRTIIGFELAGEDHIYHLAEAEVQWDGQTIDIRCPEVPNPIAVRYSWRNYMGSNLHKTLGIPVPPFRTDDWNPYE